MALVGYQRVSLQERLRPDMSNSYIVGWNSWNIFACDISQEKILMAAQKTVELGLRVSSRLDSGETK
jgi:hypothetical protein